MSNDYPHLGGQYENSHIHFVQSRLSLGAVLSIVGITVKRS